MKQDYTTREKPVTEQGYDVGLRSLLGRAAKAITFVGLAYVATAAPGCITVPDGIDKGDYREGMRELRQEYKAIDSDNLTGEQKERLKKFNQLERMGFSDNELDFINMYPWIDSNKLSDADKAFLMKEFEGFAIIFR